MATISFTTTTEEDTAIQWATDRYNADSKEALTPAQFFRGHVRHRVQGWVQQYKSATTISKGEAYQLATPEDKATIDAILAKYQVA